VTKLSKNDILKEVNRISDGMGLDKEGDKRIYRKRDQWADPDAPAHAEVNRLKKRFTVRASPELLEKIEHAAEKEGLSRQEWIERACIAALDEPN
jgi:predicted DNA binding CopG/RHH family protein